VQDLTRRDHQGRHASHCRRRPPLPCFRPADRPSLRPAGMR